MPKNDLALIERVLSFASWRVIESQQQVYLWFGDHPFVEIRENPDGSIEHVLKAIKPEEGVGPFIADQRKVKAALLALARKDSKAIDRVRDEVIEILGETFGGALRLGWRRGQFRITVEPSLSDVRALLWYAVALIFHYTLERRVRSCAAQIDGEKCGRFFLFTPELRKYCNPEHAVIGKKQAVLQAVKNWQRENPKETRRKSRPKRKNRRRKK